MRIGNKLLFALLILVALVSLSINSPAEPGGQVSATASLKAAPKISVLNPEATNAMVPRLPLTARLSSLQGKVIYMVDIGWGGPEAGYDVLQVISKRLAQDTPTVKTVVLRKKGAYSADDPDLWKEIKAKGQAAILGLSC
jgi:hypothetical protein